MPLLETKGAASAQGFGLTLGGAQPAQSVYIEDVFSTYLYTGNGSTQTITNGIDLSTKGGLVWIKGRSGATDHALYDTARGATKDLVSNSTAAETTQSTGLTAFNGTGFSIGALAKLNTNAATYASWTFRKQPKFFDIVTYTGDGTNNRAISHNLGSTPGFIIVKSTSNPTDWVTYHRSYTFPNWIRLNSTDAESTTYGSAWGAVPTSTTFTTGSGGFGDVNYADRTYVAYLFAHNAGGFGLSGTDNVISCGSWTSAGSTPVSVNLGYEPQWILWKRTSNTGNWYLSDNMRGLPVQNGVGTGNKLLYPNLPDDEYGDKGMDPTSTGFNVAYGASGNTFIYIAIRRGPMKVPTSGTSVYNTIARTGTGANLTTAVGFPVDLVIPDSRSTYGMGARFVDRLRGGSQYLTASSTAAEVPTAYMKLDVQTGVNYYLAGQDANVSTVPYVDWNFRRAPGFFDEVCYTGTGTTNNALTHNLGVAPELVIIKSRSFSPTNWPVATGFTSTGGRALNLNQTGGDGGAEVAYGTGWQIGSQPTATTLTIGGTANAYNGSGQTYVMYLFATCAGVSKVGSYTGNGSSQTINCGFTGGARFVLIKRTDSTGDWYVWDTARGIVAGNDPHLSLNSTAAEVTTNDSIDTDSIGFIVNQLAATDINVSSATYIFLAIA